MFQQKRLCESPFVSSAPLKHVGIVGAGIRLRRILKHVLAETEGQSIKIVSAFDPDRGSLDALRDMLGYDFDRAATAEEVATSPEIEWVFIGSWNCFHANQSIMALNAGKHVFCEKPLATSIEECLAIRDAARRSGKVFFFGLVLRYSQHYQKINEIVRSGSLGNVLSFEFNETLGFNHGGYIFGNWRRKVGNAGSHMLEKCCHDLDIANWITGSLPIKVASFGGKDFFRSENKVHAERIGASETGIPAYRSWPDPHRVDPFDGSAEILDNQVVILQYANGMRAMFHANCNAAIPERRMYLCGTEGSLRANLSAQDIEWKRVGWSEEPQSFNSGHGDLHGGGDRVMAAALVRTMMFGDPPLASVEEGIASAITAFAIDRATETGQVVDLTPLWEKAKLPYSV